MFCDLWYRDKTKVNLKTHYLWFIENLRQVDCYVNTGGNRWIKVADDFEFYVCNQNEKPTQIMTCTTNCSKLTTRITLTRAACAKLLPFRYLTHNFIDNPIFFQFMRDVRSSFNCGSFEMDRAECNS